MSERRDEEYLGDGVYISHDGYQVWLTTQQSMQIALEPGLPEAIVAYWQRILKKYQPKETQS